MIRRFVRGVAFAACALSACSPRVPHLQDPTSVRSFCEHTREARITGVRSVMTSTDDKLTNETPTSTDVERAVEAGDDGVIAYWHAQPLALPGVAHALGIASDYVAVDAAAVPPAVDLQTTRPLYLEIRIAGRDRWIGLTAYDTQDVCVEGHRDV